MVPWYCCLSGSACICTEIANLYVLWLVTGSHGLQLPESIWSDVSCPRPSYWLMGCGSTGKSTWRRSLFLSSQSCAYKYTLNQMVWYRIINLQEEWVSYDAVQSGCMQSSIDSSPRIVRQGELSAAAAFRLYLPREEFPLSDPCLLDIKPAQGDRIRYRSIVDDRKQTGLRDSHHVYTQVNWLRAA